MRGAFATVVMLCFALAAQPAAAARTGIEDVRIGANAAATKGHIEVTWVAQCTGKLRTWRSSTYDGAPFARDARRPRRTAVEDRVDRLIKPRYRANENAYLSARHLAGYRWRGTFRASVTVYRGSRRVARCRVPATTWNARAPRIRVQVFRDPLDGTPPFSRGASTPSNAVSLKGDRKAFEVHFGDDLPGLTSGFDISVGAPGARPERRGGPSLRRGRQTDARRYPFNGKHPGLGFSGNGNGCDEIFGEYDIKSLRFTRGGLIDAVRLTFVSHCDSLGNPPTRGSVTYRR